MKVGEFRQTKIRSCLFSEEGQKLKPDNFWRSQAALALFYLSPTLLGDSV